MSARSFLVDIGTLEKDLRALGDKAPLALSRALNRAALAGQTAMVKTIGAETGIAAKNIKREIRLDKATRSTPKITFHINGQRIPLIAFGARGPEPTRGKGAGVTAGVKGARKTYPGAFIATVGAGHRGVFKRRLPSRRRSSGAWAPNLPITELHGPSVALIFEKHISVFEKTAGDAVLANLRHEIDFAAGSSPATEGA